MNDRTIFESALREAWNSLTNNDKGRLILPYRKMIWRSMGQRQPDAKKGAFGPGLQRRTRLAVRCVTNILPIWTNSFPNNRFPYEVIAQIEKYQDGIVDAEKFSRELSFAWTKMDNLMAEFPDSTAVYVGISAIKAARVALGDEVFDPDHVDLSERDEQFDPYELDTSWYACAVFSGDPFGNEWPVIEKRREFWRWYLEIAAPNSWES